jgi:hypothetical protein
MKLDNAPSKAVIPAAMMTFLAPAATLAAEGTGRVS